MMYRLGISNIAWPNNDKEKIYAQLRHLGVEGIEIALTKFGTWELLNSEIVRKERELLSTYGLQFSSFQSLYFERPDLQLLSSDAAFQAMLAHTVRVAQLAKATCNGAVGVFGAPRNRKRGEMPYKDAFILGVERLRHLAEAVNPYNFVLAIEPAPPEYQGDFLRNETECALMVAAVNHPSLRLHLDSGCLVLSGEDVNELLAKHGGTLGHVHLSRPQLAPFDSSEIPFYSKILGTLREKNYEGWVVIEMREADDPVLAIETAIDIVRSAEKLL